VIRAQGSDALEARAANESPARREIQLVIKGW
jgi:hypothetical protein